MTLSFAGWTVEKIVGKLTKREVLACLPSGWIRASDGQKWKSLRDAVFRLSDEMKAVVYEAACTKDCLLQETSKEVKKRKREKVAWIRRTRRRSCEGMPGF
jgi:hypothetical protein